MHLTIEIDMSHRMDDGGRRTVCARQEHVAAARWACTTCSHEQPYGNHHHHHYHHHHHHAHDMHVHDCPWLIPSAATSSGSCSAWPKHHQHHHDPCGPHRPRVPRGAFESRIEHGPPALALAARGQLQRAQQRAESCMEPRWSRDGAEMHRAATSAAESRERHGA